MLQLRTIEPRTLELLKELCNEPVLDTTFLVGGTSLALQLGHRFSVDLDLFTHTPFSADLLLGVLESRYDVQPITVTDTIFIVVVEGIKVDVVHFRYPFAQPLLNIDGVRLADIRDVAPMKLDAVTKRGSKKGFFDMYYLIQMFGLPQILEWYCQMFKHSTSFHVIRSLTYFVDAEIDAMPIVFDESITWANVKSSIIQAVQDL
jgi:Nucleotidyl transferase AbiEii toxin, Type IV TA system